jgi:hypothetical protein
MADLPAVLGHDLDAVLVRDPVLASFLIHPHNRVQAADCRRLLNSREPAKVAEISGRPIRLERRFGC